MNIFYDNENFEHWQIFGLKNLGAGSRKECLQGVLHSLKSSCLSKATANKISWGKTIRAFGGTSDQTVVGGVQKHFKGLGITEPHRINLDHIKYHILHHYLKKLYLIYKTPNSNVTFNIQNHYLKKYIYHHSSNIKYYLKYKLFHNNWKKRLLSHVITIIVAISHNFAPFRILGNPRGLSGGSHTSQ